MSSRRTARTRAAPRRGDVREHALLAAAERMLASGSFEAASIAEIGAQAGISRPTFYFYFASKQALLAQLISHTLEELGGRIGGALRDDGADPRATIADALRATAAVWREHRDVMCAAVELSPSVPEIAALWDETVEATVELGVRLLVEHGEVPEARDHGAARELVRTLAWSTERNFYNLMRGAAGRRSRPSETDALVARLTAVWLRTTGIAER